jgi:hypothetical protein
MGVACEVTSCDLLGDSRVVEADLWHKVQTASYLQVTNQYAV